VADQAARRAKKGETQLAAAGRPHFLHFGLAAAHLIVDDSGKFLVDIDHDLLDRLEPLAGRRIAGEQHPRSRDRQLEASAPHRLDQDAELQLTAPGNFERILLSAFADADRDIAPGFAIQACQTRRDG
jgi:hypothetical protein